MSMGSFMPMPAPLMSGGGGGLDGMITVGNDSSFGFALYGWSDGSVFPVFGSISGPATSYIIGALFWVPDGSLGYGQAYIIEPIVGARLSIFGYDYYTDEDSPDTFYFDLEAELFPTSGTHPFTITLP